jgi:hypothetical protein
MKRILPIVGLAMLAACNQAAPSDDAAQAAAAPAGPHSNAAPGTFTYTDAKGQMVTSFLAEDGTYTDWVAGAMTERGKWAVKDNKSCFTPENGKEQCTSDSPMGADGTFTATPDEGAPYKVTKTG